MTESANELANIVPLTRRKPEKTALTQRSVDTAKARAERYEVRDPSLPGFMLRVSANSKTYAISARIGHGRGTKRVRVTIGDARIMKLHEAREQARRIIAEAKSGIDPTAAPTDQPVSDHLDDYEARLVRDEVVKTADMMTTLRRGLDGKLADQKLSAG